jgi:hypothetical protein
MIHDSNQESTIIIEPSPPEAEAEAEPEAEAEEAKDQTPEQDQPHEDKEDSDIDPCIFCISETPSPIRYKGECGCHPPVHPECINAWHARNPKQCPICLKGPVSNNIIIRTNAYTPKCTLIAAALCCATICCGPFIMIGVVFSLYPMPPRGYNTTHTANTANP